MSDKRAQELQQVVIEGGVLPLPVSQILALEDRGYVVDLATGDVSPVSSWVVAPTAAGRAVNYLMSKGAGDK
jgi:hypothetical protein